MTLCTIALTLNLVALFTATTFAVLLTRVNEELRTKVRHLENELRTEYQREIDREQAGA